MAAGSSGAAAPLLGLTRGRASRNRACAAARLIPRFFMSSASTIVAEREMPAWQYTSTVHELSLDLAHCVARSKCCAMFSLGT